jgi:hypothetical protein
MQAIAFLGGLAAALVLTMPAAHGAAEPLAAAGRAEPIQATHDELGRALDELAGQLHGLGERLRGHFSPADAPERPVVSIMLDHRAELGLTPSQVQELERIRSDFQREAIKVDADLRVAQMDLSSLLRADPVDMGKVEPKVREIERLRADLRLGRLRAIERGKAQLTPDQRSKLQSLLGESSRPRAGGAGVRRL